MGGRTSFQLSLEAVVGEEEGPPGATGAGRLGEAAPWRGFLWVGGAGLRRLLAAGAAAMEAGCRCQGWTWWWYSVARVAAYLLPCCSLEGEVEPAVAMVAEVQKEGEVAGCWGEEVGVASCPLEVAADPWDVRDPGPWEAGEAASRGEACRWGLGALGGLPCWALVEGSVGVLHGHHDRHDLRDLHDFHACRGSSCFPTDQSSSREAGSAVVAGCCSALRTEALLHGCWSVLHLMRGPGPLLAQPSGTDTPCPYEPCPALTGEALHLSLCGQQMSWCTCSQRRCGLLHHTWYRGWCW